MQTSFAAARSTRPRAIAPAGFMLADLLLALVLFALVIAVMSQVITEGRRAEQRFARQRHAIRLAETTLTRLQIDAVETQAEAEHLPFDTSVRIVELPIDHGDNWPGMVWVRVEASVDHRTASVDGVISTGRAEGLRDEGVLEVTDE